MNNVPKAAVINLYHKGYSIDAIGKLVGINRETIRRHLHVWGVKLRPRGRPLKAKR